MDIKYFYYISDYKVGMLKAQLNSWELNVPDINPKMEFAGLSFGANIKFRKDENLVRETLSLINRLQKSELLKTLDTNIPDSKNYYKDESVWFSGIFSFQPFIHKSVGAYFLWKILGDTLILLIGSPCNILGVGDLESDSNLMSKGGTPLLIEHLLSYINKVSQRNEIETISDNLDVDPEWLNKLIDLDRISYLARNWDNNEYPNEPLSQLPKRQDENNLKHGMAIVLFCAKHLRKLRQQKIETIFKVIMEVKLDRRNDLPELIAELEKIPLQDSERNKLSKCKQVIIGSPIYTALI